MAVGEDVIAVKEVVEASNGKRAENIHKEHDNMGEQGGSKSSLSEMMTKQTHHSACHFNLEGIGKGGSHLWWLFQETVHSSRQCLRWKREC
jgi:hypothetical protein